MSAGEETAEGEEDKTAVHILCVSNIMEAHRQIVRIRQVSTCKHAWINTC